MNGTEQKLLPKFPGFATSGRHNPAMITNRRKADCFETNTVLCSFDTIQPSSIFLSRFRAVD